MNWTIEQEEFLLAKKREGFTAKEICKKMNRKFKIRRNAPQLDSKLYNLKKKGHTSDEDRKVRGKNNKYIRFTQEKVDFVHGCFKNNFPRNMIMQGYEEQFGEKIADNQVYYIIKKKRPTNSILIEERIADKKLAKTIIPRNYAAVWHTDTASKKQCALLIKLKFPDLNSRERTLMINDLYNSASLNKKIASDEITELKGLSSKKEKAIIEETLEETRLNRTRHKWTDKEELELLCDFYELSIDEARERFQRPFYAIAKRLEMIVDSTEPKHIDMLMAASKIIKERKQVRDKAAKTGFLKRRHEVREKTE